MSKSCQYAINFGSVLFFMNLRSADIKRVLTAKIKLATAFIELAEKSRAAIFSSIRDCAEKIFPTQTLQPIYIKKTGESKR